MFGNLRQLDGYAKTLDDFRVKTTTGASGKLFILISCFLHICEKKLIQKTRSVWLT